METTNGNISLWKKINHEIRARNTPVVGQNLVDRSQAAGKAAYSREYGLVHLSAMSSDGG